MTRYACDNMRTLLVIQPIPEGLTLDSKYPFPGPIISGPHVEAREMRHFHWYGLLVECALLPTNGFVVRMCFEDRIYPPESVKGPLDDYSQAIHELACGLTEGEPCLSNHQIRDSLSSLSEIPMDEERSWFPTEIHCYELYIVPRDTFSKTL